MACYVAEQDMVDSWHAMSLQYRTRESNVNLRSTASVDWEAPKVILLESRVREHATKLAALAADLRPKDPLLYLSSFLSATRIIALPILQRQLLELWKLREVQIMRQWSLFALTDVETLCLVRRTHITRM
jgi:hypothetical protein